MAETPGEPSSHSVLLPAPCTVINRCVFFPSGDLSIPSAIRREGQACFGKAGDIGGLLVYMCLLCSSQIYKASSPGTILHLSYTVALWESVFLRALLPHEVPPHATCNGVIRCHSFTMAPRWPRCTVQQQMCVAVGRSDFRAADVCARPVL